MRRIITVLEVRMVCLCLHLIIFRERREQEQRERERLDKERLERERRDKEERERRERERAKMRELEIQKERDRQAMEDVNRHFELSMELAKKVSRA